jgi:Zn-dependent protease
MRGSLKLFTWFGIPVYVHWTFSLIFFYVLYFGIHNNLDAINFIWLFGFFIALFGCVLLHEYGHSLTARRYDVETRDIVLTPIGGIARLERMPEKPDQEFLVAVAGPAVNIGIAIVLVALGWLIFHGERWELFKFFFEQQFPSIFQSEEADDVVDATGAQPGGLLFYLPALLATNIWLVLFNMIPAFPMDGGRVFRSLLAMRIGRVRATRVASIVGQGMALLFIFYGFWKPAYSLAFIGFFVFSMARTENAMVQLEELFRLHKASDLLRSQFTRLSANDWMQTPIELLNHGLERNFLVFDFSDNLVGALTESRILEAAKKRDLSTEIARYMQPVTLVDATESLQYVYFLLRQNEHSIVAIGSPHELLGVVDQDGLRNFMKLQGMR